MDGLTQKKIVPNCSGTSLDMIQNIEKNNLPKDNYIISDTVSATDSDSLLQVDSEVKKKFEPHKKKTYPLALCYQRIGEDKRAKSVSECGTFLEWRLPANSRWKLTYANFCRDRLCPLCSVRRSYKIFAQVSKIMNVIQDDFDFIFLTLTVPNVKGTELSSKIDEMQKAFRQMMQFDSRIKKAVCGYFKALEVTHNKNRYSKSFDTYHPHFHTILAVDKGYCKSDNYIKRDEWLNIWRRVMHDERITQVDVRKCYNNRSDSDEAETTLVKAVSEAAKYAVKSSDYIIPWSEWLTDSSVRTLLSSLSNRRMCSFGGIFQQVRKALQLDDCENGDLVHVEAEKMRSDVAEMIVRYGWSCGAYKTYSIEKRKCSPLIEPAEDDF